MLKCRSTTISAEQSRAARFPDKLDLSNHIFKEFSSTYVRIAAQHKAMLKETRLKPELADTHPAARYSAPPGAEPVFSDQLLGRHLHGGTRIVYLHHRRGPGLFGATSPEALRLHPCVPRCTGDCGRAAEADDLFRDTGRFGVPLHLQAVLADPSGVNERRRRSLPQPDPVRAREHGKSFLMDLVKKKLAVPNTVEEVQERTACAHRTMQPPIFHLTELTPEVGGEAWGQGGPNGKRSTGSGDNDKINVLKSEITENATSYKTLLPIEDTGKRQQITVRLARHGGKILATNINDIVHAFSSAFLTRFITFQVAQICREDGEISDKMAFSSLSVVDEHSQKLKKEIIPLCFRHEQAFHATVCMLVNSGILVQPDTSCIAVLLNYVKRSLQRKSIGYHAPPQQTSSASAWQSSTVTPICLIDTFATGTPSTMRIVWSHLRILSHWNRSWSLPRHTRWRQYSRLWHPSCIGRKLTR